MTIRRPLLLTDEGKFEELHIEETVMAEFIREIIPVSMVLHVLEDYQYIVYNKITVDGSITLDGKLVIL